MNKVFCLEYKGYHTNIHWNAIDDVYFGKIEEAYDHVAWEAETRDDCEKSFREAVDDYIKSKKELKK